jgi:hypothetical protein
MARFIGLCFGISLVAFLGGCAAGDELTFGPSPVLQATETQRSTDNRLLVLSSLREDAAGGVDAPVTWYDVTIAGFNFVDDQCTTYFNDLFKLRRRNEAAQSGLSAFNGTTNAILAATGSTTLSMVAVAQAFSLGSKLVDIHSDTFLYNLPPSETSQFVNEMQRAYRDGVELQRGAINSPMEAYHRIQGYLSLCLPQTIEARLVRHVSDAKAAAVGNVSGTDVDVVVSSPITLEEKAQRATRLAIIERPDVPLLRIDPAPKTAGSLNAFEQRLTRAQILQVQKVLCVKDVDGSWGASTRAAVVEFFNGAGTPREHIAQKGISDTDWETLFAEVAGRPDCKDRSENKSAFEFGKLAR